MMLEDTYILGGLIQGPFVNEREVKQALLQVLRAKYIEYTFFEIENTEKAPGMPDVLCVHSVKPAVFIEIKYIREDGRVKFQYNQPLWYKQNAGLNIYVLAWDSRHEYLVNFSIKDILAAKKLVVPIDSIATQDSMCVRAFEKERFLWNGLQ